MIGLEKEYFALFQKMITVLLLYTPLLDRKFTRRESIGRGGHSQGVTCLGIEPLCLADSKESFVRFFSQCSLGCQTTDKLLFGMAHHTVRHCRVSKESWMRSCPRKVGIQNF